MHLSDAAPDLNRSEGRSSGCEACVDEVLDWRTRSPWGTSAGRCCNLTKGRPEPGRGRGEPKKNGNADLEWLLTERLTRVTLFF